MTSPYSLPRAPYPTPQANGYIRRPPPAVNPFDKVSQGDVDGMLARVTGQLRRALGFEVPEPEPTIKPLPPAFDAQEPEAAQESGRLEGQHPDKEDESMAEDSFADVMARRKGKARDPREGPGLGGHDAPIELLSDSDEEQREGSHDELSEDAEGEEGEEEYVSESEQQEQQWDEEQEGSPEFEEEQGLRSSPPPPEVFEVLDSDEDPEVGDTDAAPLHEDEFANEPSPEYDDEDEGGIRDAHLDPEHPYYVDTAHAITGAHPFDGETDDGYEDEVGGDAYTRPSGVVHADDDGEDYEEEGANTSLGFMRPVYHGQPAHSPLKAETSKPSSSYVTSYGRLPLATPSANQERASPEIVELLDDNDEEHALGFSPLRDAAMVQEVHQDDEVIEGDIYSDEVADATPALRGDSPIQPVYHMIDDDDEDGPVPLVDDNCEFEHLSATPVDPLFPEDGPTGMFGGFEQPVELPDVWNGPRAYAEDFYSGGDFPAGAFEGRDVDPSRLTPEREAIVANADNGFKPDLLNIPMPEGHDDMALTPPAFPTPGEEEDLILAGSRPEDVDEEIIEVLSTPKGATTPPQEESAEDVDMDNGEDGTLTQFASRDVPPHLLPPVANTAVEERQTQKPSSADARSVSPAAVLHERIASPAAAASGHLDWTHPPAFPTGVITGEECAAPLSVPDDVDAPEDLLEAEITVEEPSEVAPSEHSGFTPVDFGTLPPTPRDATGAVVAPMETSFAPGLEELLGVPVNSTPPITRELQDYFDYIDNAPGGLVLPNPNEEEKLADDNDIKLMSEWLAGDESSEVSSAHVEMTTELADYVVSEPVEEGAAALEIKNDDAVLVEDAFTAEELSYVVEEFDVGAERSLDVSPPNETHVELPFTAATQEMESNPLTEVGFADEDPTVELDAVVEDAQTAEVKTVPTASTSAPIELSQPITKLLPDLDTHLKAIVSTKDALTIPLPPFPQPDPATLASGHVSPYLTPAAATEGDNVNYFTPGPSRPPMSRAVSITKVIPAIPGLVEALMRQQSAAPADAAPAENEAMVVEDAEVANANANANANPLPVAQAPPPAPQVAPAAPLLNEQLATPETTPEDTEPLTGAGAEEGELAYPELDEVYEDAPGDASDHESIASSVPSQSAVAEAISDTLPVEPLPSVLVEESAPSGDESPPLEPIIVGDDEEIPGLTLSGMATPHMVEDASSLSATINTLEGGAFDNEPLAVSNASRPLEETLATAAPLIVSSRIEAMEVEHTGPEEFISLSATKSDSVTLPPKTDTPRLGHTAAEGLGDPGARLSSLAVLRTPSSKISSDAYPYYLSNPGSAAMLVGSDDSMEGDSIISSSSKSSDDKHDDDATESMNEAKDGQDTPHDAPEEHYNSQQSVREPSASPSGDLEKPGNHAAEDMDADADGEVDDDYVLSNTTSVITTPLEIEAPKEEIQTADHEPHAMASPDASSIIPPPEMKSTEKDTQDAPPSPNEAYETITPVESISSQDTEENKISASDTPVPDPTTVVKAWAGQVAHVPRSVPEKSPSDGALLATPSNPQKALPGDTVSSPFSDSVSVSNAGGSDADADTDSSGPQAERPARPPLTVTTASLSRKPAKDRQSSLSAKQKGKQKESPAEGQNKGHVDDALKGGSDNESASTLSELSPAVERFASPKAPETPRSYSMPQVPSVQRGNIYHQHGAKKTGIVTQLPGRPVMPPPRRGLKTLPLSLDKELSPSSSASRPQTPTQAETPTPVTPSKSQPVAAAQSFPTPKATRPMLSQPTPSVLNMSRAVTRSHCKFHKISVEREDDGPRVFFIVPSCALVRKDVMESEDIQDHGDATVEDTLRMEAGVEDLDLSDEIKSNLRLLVGMDVLRELEIFYLPVDGVDVRRKRRPPVTERPSERLKKRESVARAGRGALEADIASARKRKRALTERSVSTVSLSDNEGSVKEKNRSTKTPRRIIILGPRAPTIDGPTSRSPSIASTAPVGPISAGPSGPSVTSSVSPGRPLRTKRRKSQPVYKDSTDENESDADNAMRQARFEGILKRKRTEDDQPYSQKEKRKRPPID